MLLRFAQTDGSVELYEKDSATLPKAQPAAAGFARVDRQGIDTGRQLLTILQTTIDLDEVLRAFAREIAASVPHSGLAFRHAARDIELTIGRGARHSANFQLVIDNQDLGEISFTRGKEFSDSEQARLRYYISCLVFPLRNALRYHDAVRASLTDPLTGVHNRAFFEAALRREFGLSRRHNNPLSLIVIDVDHFKSINDEHGHLAGDSILRCVTRSISSCLRETDMLARYGGDEFTILLSNTTSRGVRTVATHIMERVGATPCSAGETVLRVSVTIGAATLLKRDSQAGFFARADGAMYRAKDAGGGSAAIATSRATRILNTSPNAPDTAT